MDHIVTFGGSEQPDPYHEDIPENELHFYQRKGAKRKRKLPSFIAAHDLKVLESVKRKAYQLDLQLSICGLRLGWAGIIGLIPWVGDVIACAFALLLVKKAGTIEGGLPAVLQSKMMFNVAMDFGIGLIPLVGDFINILYKCNSRNFILLEKHLVEKYSKQAPGLHAPVSGKRGDHPDSGNPPHHPDVTEKPPQHPDLGHGKHPDHGNPNPQESGELV